MFWNPWVQLISNVWKIFQTSHPVKITQHQSLELIVYSSNPIGDILFPGSNPVGNIRLYFSCRNWRCFHNKRPRSFARIFMPHWREDWILTHIGLFVHRECRNGLTCPRGPARNDPVGSFLCTYTFKNLILCIIRVLNVLYVQRIHIWYTQSPPLLHDSWMDLMRSALLLNIDQMVVAMVLQKPWASTHIQFTTTRVVIPYAF